MVFSSILFLFYFLPVFLLCYYLTPVKYKNAVILAGSVFFYAWGAPRFIFVILGTTLMDFFLVRMMAASPGQRRRRLLLCLSLTVNLGLLFYFKYSNFFVDNLNHLLSLLGAGTLPWAKLLLPIGISFYTFETITYVVDVYRGVHKPLDNFWDYQLYIILFPKLIAGPIIRYHDIAGQIYDRQQYSTAEYRLQGMYRFFLGLGKKVIIANTLGAAADLIFKMPTAGLDTATAWLGALSYTFQIYFDFSGYSDMAIGLALLMGFRFPENFNNPYTAVSITDFWRRWHISLGSWMRNYLYIPLGGNKRSDARTYFNLWVVFLASGFWHGATWGFIIWGAYHGFFLVIERMFLGRWLQKLGRFAVLYTFPVVLIGWVVFRLEHLGPALHYLQRMFSWHGGWDPQLVGSEFWTMTAIAAFFAFFTLSRTGQHIQDQVFCRSYNLKLHVAMTLTVLALCLIIAGRITTSDFNPFIYFRF